MQKVKLVMEVESTKIGEEMEKIEIRETIQETIIEDLSVQNGQGKLEAVQSTAEYEYDYVNLNGSSSAPEKKEAEIEGDEKTVDRPNLVLVYFYSGFFWIHGLSLVIISSMSLGYLNQGHELILGYSLEWTGLVISGIVIGVIRLLLSSYCLFVRDVDDKGRINLCSLGAFVYIGTSIGLVVMTIWLLCTGILSFLYDGNEDKTGIRAVLSAFIYAVVLEPFYIVFGVCMKLL